MNDYYDPPEYPELPECCDDEMECDEDGVCTCPTCGKTVQPYRDIEPPEDAPEDVFGDLDRPTGYPACPHGVKGQICHQCEHEADLAFDAKREYAL
jgi:hypothetical protein